MWHEPLRRKTDQVVVLAQVLAHRDNLGYDQLNDQHLVKVNGHDVRSLAHLSCLIEEERRNGAEFLRLQFGPPGRRVVVLEVSELDRVTREVCKEHAIPKASYLHDQHIDEDREEIAEPDEAVATASKSGEVNDGNVIFEA